MTATSTSRTGEQGLRRRVGDPLPPRPHRPSPRSARDASRRLREDFAPLIEVIWVDRERHERGLDSFFSRSRSISLVDAISFACMRDLRLERAWTLDGHFAEEGFEVLE
jgi:predicted nucleic acid-binding protein